MDSHSKRRRSKAGKDFPATSLRRKARFTTGAMEQLCRARKVFCGDGENEYLIT